MNPIVEKVYQIGIIPVIAFNSVDEALPLCKALGDLVSEADCDHDGVAELFRKLGI